MYCTLFCQLQVHYVIYLFSAVLLICYFLFYVKCVFCSGLLNFDNEKEELCDDGDDTYKFLHEYCSIPDAGHNVLVLQPGEACNVLVIYLG